MSATTLVAIRTDSGERVSVTDLPSDVLRTLSDSHSLRCPHCNTLLTLKAGLVREHHFAHVSLSDCDSFDHEPESDSHRHGKLLLYHTFRRGATLAALEQHLPATDQRADVYIQTAEQTADCIGYALEFQQANNSVMRWNERHAMYRSIGVADVWFLGQVRYHERTSEALHPISPYDPLPVPHHEFDAASGSFQARELEKAIFAAERRLYYLDPDSALLTILLARNLHGNTLRAYCYRVPLAGCSLRAGKLWTPLDPLLDDYRRFHAEQVPS
jgi:Competence protein CoiA-like family